MTVLPRAAVSLFRSHRTEPESGFTGFQDGDEKLCSQSDGAEAGLSRSHSGSAEGGAQQQHTW